MKKSQKGFTIIEVALVLAIGALIFLVVFLAVPALQRNQRNDARKRDVSNIVQAVADFNANHSTSGMRAIEGVYKINGEGSVAKNEEDRSLGAYIDTMSTNITAVNVKSGATELPTGYNNVDNSSIINVYTGAKCNADGNNITKAAGRQSAVVGVMETATGYTVYCSDAS